VCPSASVDEMVWPTDNGPQCKRPIVPQYYVTCTNPIYTVLFLNWGCVKQHQ